MTESGWNVVDRCVVLVDAGYLLGAAASLLAGEPTRSRISVDHAGLIQALRRQAEADTECALLRIYWFDGAPDRVPQPEHRRLRVMPRVTVRLGALTRSDGRWAQKGVDAAMHAELTELARNRACSDIVLVTGDGDLLPGLMSAKEHGVAVHLWAVQAADGDYNQSEDLVAEADERRVLDRGWITPVVRAKDLTGPCAPQPAPRPEIAAILAAPLPEPGKNGDGSGNHGAAASPGPAASAPAGPGGGPAEAAGRTARAETDERPAAEEPASGGGASPGPGRGEGVPTPKDLADLGRHGPQAQAQASTGPPGATLRWSSDRGWVERAVPPESPETAALPTLAQLTTAEQRWADREEDITAVSGDPYEVGQVFARRWIERLTNDSHLGQLSGEYPRIPHRIDGELLRYAARFGLLAHKDDQIDEHDRYAIRAGFWREVDARSGAPAEHTPAGD
ncbi:NYN domain-containing protein [Streptomyces albus subsp. chlorinus]|uniref:NYN domain-containing protein n=1 Tax=Streptomyces albus TaxID=1888 RepID=UPI00156FCC11|nr:NYN domain-containing protein [Streptomyces albus]NSC21166.1 NYN domain-containing protein [Streptomyces albus subsp. chlorinus]